MNTKTSKADLILIRGLFTTLNRSRPAANAVALKDGKFMPSGAMRM